MKTTTLTFFISILLLNVSAQMRVKKPNFTSFNIDKKISSEILYQLSSAEAKRHPEYGTLPFNAQCSDCAEMIDKRTIDSRLFIDPKNSGHTYSQKSYFPLHYKKSENDIWRTIDFRLRPDANHPGVFTANDQPCPTKIDLNKHSTSITDRGFEFEYNKNLSLYFFDADNAYTQSTSANYTTTHVGQEGMEVENIWTGINMEATFRGGEIKTNFVLNAPLQLPISKGWMVIEDHFSLPAGYSFVESKTGEHDGSFFGGDYVVVDEQGRTRITYERPSFVDAMAWGVKGNYQLEKLGNNYTLKLFVPVSWLNRTDNTYPLFIDPTVAGWTKRGDFTATPGGFTESFGFTTKPGSCNYHMPVQVPGKSTLTNVYVDLEYRLQFDPTCGNPHLPSPFCTFSQVSQEIICDACGTTTGNLVCDPSSPPYTGTCTTDSNLTAGAGPIRITSLVPNYVSCIPPQCTNYAIDFTLKNRDSTCQDACGWLCAMGYMWQMTVEGYWETQPPLIITSNDTLVCSPIPSYQWYLDDSLISGATNRTYIPTQNGSYKVVYFDSIGCSMISNVINVTSLGIINMTEESISIYPNPTTNLLFINAQGTTIKSVSLYNVDGKLMREVKQLTENGIDISGFSKGVYIAEIKTKDLTVKRRWTKM